LHAFKPQWLTLDWPSIVLLLVGVLLIFVPVDDIGAIIESLEIGKTKILFRKVKKLNEDVNRAEAEAQAERAKAVETAPDMKMNDNVNIQGTSFSVPVFAKLVSRLLSGDKELALIRIAIELERRLSELAGDAGFDVSRPRPLGQMARQLQGKGVISQETANALREFWQVRNLVVHHGAGTPSDSALASTIDSGVKLLRILDAAPDQ
jgi:hypothetical protein